MSKARTDVAIPAISINSIEAANKIVQLINSRPTTPSVVEIARVLDEHGPAVVESPALLEWRRLEAENKAAWAALSLNPDDNVANRIDDDLHAYSHKLMRRPVMSWDDVGVLGDLGMYWLYPPTPDGGNPDLLHDMRSRDEGFDTQVIAHLLNGIARLTGGRHV